MSEVKTKKNNSSVLDFLNSVEDEQKRKDSLELLKIFEEVTGEKAKMWGIAIIGFGEYHYKSERSTQEGDWPLTAFSPRKQSLTVYIMSGFESAETHNKAETQDIASLLGKLGKYKTSVSCLYIKKLSDVDTNILKEIVAEGYRIMKERYSV